jgi:hypothetical protein
VQDSTRSKESPTLDANNLDRVITVSNRIMGAMPWRGDPSGLELGLFSVKSGNLLTPLINYVTKISDKAGISVPIKLDPFVPLITEGLDMIAGQTNDTEIELAIDTGLSLTESRFCALVAKPKGSIDAARLTIDPQDRKLLETRKSAPRRVLRLFDPEQQTKCRVGQDSPRQESYADFIRAITSGKHKEAEEALAGFNRQVIVSPDLISADKNRLKEKANAVLQEAFPGGGQAATPEALRQRFETLELADLNRYEDRGTV